MLRIECHNLPAEVSGDVVVVIDVLRMTTTAAALFESGLQELMVVADIGAARELAAVRGALLVGERGGVELDGFDGGNSPLEYVGRDLKGMCAVLCSSNGSRAVEEVAGADELLLGCINNARAVAQSAVSLSQDRISLVCAGTGNRLSFDDVLAAGSIARELLKLEPEAALDDGARLALLALESSPGLGASLMSTGHGRTLAQLGFTADIEFAAALNRSCVVPIRSLRRPATFVDEPLRMPTVV
ncbi:MAG: 2-phosphosulfolactate phosphatase [Trueperaceae bacterium]